MIWRPIPGLPLEASSEGEIRRAGKLMSIRTLPDGYKRVSYKIAGKSYTTGVHRLVCSAFHGVPAGGMAADHINRNRGDNRADNLRWLSTSENLARRPRGSAHHKAKITEADAAQIRLSIESVHELARRYGLSRSTIRKVRDGVTWSGAHEAPPAAA